MPAHSSKTAKYLIFISHSTKDRWVARQIAKLISEKGAGHGIEVFLDEKDIEGGDIISDAIRKNIQECNEFLVLLTEASINSDWVLIELGATWGYEKRIIAIVDKIAPEQMPQVLNLNKAIELNNIDDYLKQVVNRAKRGKGK